MIVMCALTCFGRGHMMAFFLLTFIYHSCTKDRTRAEAKSQFVIKSGPTGVMGLEVLDAGGAGVDM